MSENEKNSTIKKGHLKIFMGYASGVGKTFTMLNEGNRRLSRGEDIVIGFIESHGRCETLKQIDKLEIIPTKEIDYDDQKYIEMDLEAIINRKPTTVLIDEFAHSNPPGTKNKKRYQDIDQILNSGINVITTLNIQHLESLNDIVKQITGTVVKDTIPDSVLKKADEVVVVDLTPEALQNRLNRGDICSIEEISYMQKSFFKISNLGALRELVLRETAEEVEEELEGYLKSEGINNNWKTVERVLVCIGPGAFAKKLIRRGARISHRYRCEWIVANVNCTHFLAKKNSLHNRQTLYKDFQLAKQLGAEVVTLTGKSVSEELTRFAQERNVSQIIIGHSNRTKVETLFRGSTINKLLKKSKNIEIHIIPSD